jgi:hypothetical protein
VAAVTRGPDENILDSSAERSEVRNVRAAGKRAPVERRGRRVDNAGTSVSLRNQSGTSTEARTWVNGLVSGCADRQERGSRYASGNPSKVHHRAAVCRVSSLIGQPRTALG